MPYQRPQLPFVLARPEEPGNPFVDYLDNLLGGDRVQRERLEAFLQQWDHIADDLAREPTAEEYGERRGVPTSTVRRILEEFRAVFPTERTPGRLLTLLWDGLRPPYLSSGELGWLLAVKVRPTGAEG